MHLRVHSAILKNCASHLKKTLRSLPGLLLAAGALHAAEPGGIELTPFYAGRTSAEFNVKDSSEDVQLDASSAFGLVLGIPWQENSQLELYYSHQATELDLAGFAMGSSPVDFDVDTLQIGGTVFFPPMGKALPFFSATAGGTRFDPSAAGSKSDTFFSFGVGGGWKFYPTDRFGIRLEGRFLGTLMDSNSQVFCGIGGGGSGCLVNSSGDIVWQFEAQAGAIFRF